MTESQVQWNTRVRRWRFYGYLGTIRMLMAQLPELAKHELATEETKAQANQCLCELQKLCASMSKRRDSKHDE